MEQIQARHRKEQRELQSRITQKKKNATKKTRKGVNDECDALQRDLLELQQAEIAGVSQDSLAAQIDGLNVSSDGEPSRETAPLFEGDPEGEATKANPQPKIPENNSPVSVAGPAPATAKKPNRQKARLNRRAAAQEAQAAAAAEEAANLPDLREQEMEAMRTLFKKHDLAEISIQPDGHCLYSAVAVQLQDQRLLTSEKAPSSKPYQIVRDTTGKFISNHPDDFIAFLEEPLDIYVSKIKETAEWGGQLELQAIAQAYNVCINVLQADGRIERIESDSKSFDSVLWLAYYRHSFGLGEHYNALKSTV